VMQLSQKAVAKALVTGGAGVLLTGLACYVSGARINTTESLPVGLYWTTHEPVEKGAYVMFCPPQSAVFDAAKHRGYIGAGFCAGGYGYMMKRVLAAKDDRVTINSDGVFVNGASLPHSVPFDADEAGRPMPHYHVTSLRLASDDVLLMSDICDASFDARYFGPIKRQQIKWAIRPILTW
jgi:conjugative transfer signal peptidase TraF